MANANGVVHRVDDAADHTWNIWVFNLVFRADPSTHCTRVGPAGLLRDIQIRSASAPPMADVHSRLWLPKYLFTMPTIARGLSCYVRVLYALVSSFTAHFVLRHEEVIDAIGAAGNTVYITSNMIADSVFFTLSSNLDFSHSFVIISIDAVSAVMDDRASDKPYSYSVVSQHYSKPVEIDVPRPRLRGVDVVNSLPLPKDYLSVEHTQLGRIWSLARAARVVMGQKAAGTYYTILPGVVLAQVVGIAPTIIAVRVGLGCSVEDVNSFVVPPRAAQRPFAAKMQTVSDESLGKHVLYIHATENEAAGQIG
ncbi:hypothetical protein C8F04DRAFT_1177477 [Mycena alexandri]|uniref:Uncharacterized protein n=1 Tax=Mycena alexandri TaxID=1745969 RepID=A0AAD6T9D7_9AGAR|nr:hypothetical protein C8F04DRAFT_1177477 [Mycena alexandri]